jgi:hypothetical protein
MRIGFAGKRQKDPYACRTSANSLPSGLNRADCGWVGEIFGVTWRGSRGPCTSAAVG